MKELVIAIDGPSGSGKSSVSEQIARHYQLAYLDTGAMYRALTWYCLEEHVDLNDTSAVIEAAQRFPLEQSTTVDEKFLRVGGTDVSAQIRSPRISESVSAIASVPEVRSLLVAQQRQMIEDCARRIVVEGRDITTVVAPDAHARVLLTASEEVRMARRGIQLGGTQNQQQLQKQVAERDAKDSRVNNFMEAAEGVTLVDSSELDFEQTILAVREAIEDQIHSDSALDLN
ncbi:(d)CMP kinase [Rothia sp. CCM 9418]|uniref:(d)CMP kinase n=1 Tax=unclassified Rothia (in: high G+C Gram-positive bacteria) TaxID=2689056 RepID=UPI003AC3A17D